MQEAVVIRTQKKAMLLVLSLPTHHPQKLSHQLKLTTAELRFQLKKDEIDE